MSNTKIMAGILAGLAAGALFGVLTANEKGEDTRKNILKMGDDFSSDLKSKFNDFIDSVSDGLVSSKGDAKSLVQRGVSEYMQLRAKTKQNTPNNNPANHNQGV